METLVQKSSPGITQYADKLLLKTHWNEWVYLKCFRGDRIRPRIVKTIMH